MSIKYAGPNDDDMKLWKVTYTDNNVAYVESHTLLGAVDTGVHKSRQSAVVKVEFNLCLHDNDWWEDQSEGVDCPFADWS